MRKRSHSAQSIGDLFSGPESLFSKIMVQQITVKLKNLQNKLSFQKEWSIKKALYEMIDTYIDIYGKNPELKKQTILNLPQTSICEIKKCEESLSQTFTLFLIKKFPNHSKETLQTLSFIVTQSIASLIRSTQFESGTQDYQRLKEEIIQMLISYTKSFQNEQSQIQFNESA